MSSTPNPGRVAGLWYLLLIVIGPLRLIYIPSKLFVHDDATATVNNIVAHQLLFRLGIASDLIGAVVLILLVLAFYRLFKGVDPYLAGLVVILGGVMPATIYLVNAVSDLGALMVVHGSDFLSVFDKPQRDAVAMLLLKLHDHQNTAAEMLWGAWLFPLGGLVYRSRFLPRFLGVWLVIAGCGWTQCEDGPIVEIRPGDVIWCPPGHKHWHGATPTTAMTHIAIQESLNGKNVE